MGISPKLRMQRNSTNSGRARVEQLSECKGTPTLVYYADGSIAIQHPIVFTLMHPLTSKSDKSTTPEDGERILKNLGLNE